MSDRALNMSQLEAATGFSREHLGRLCKPFLIGGKIRLSEFNALRLQQLAAPETAESSPLQVAERRFRAQEPNCDRSDAYNRLVESLQDAGA